MIAMVLLAGRELCKLLRWQFLVVDSYQDHRCIYASSYFLLSYEHNNFASVETGTLYQKIMVGFLLLFIHKNHLIKSPIRSSIIFFYQVFFFKLT
jgi:hypothetical protein